MLTNPRTQIPGGIFLTDSVIDHFFRYLMPLWPEPHQRLTFETAHGFVYTETMIQGLVQLFIFQALGELVSKFALPFIPGPVLGLVLLLAFLSVLGAVPASIDLVGGGILQHLGLLFIPASVGVVLYLPVLKANAWAISAALVISVLATVAVTAGLLKVLAKKEQAHE